MKNYKKINFILGYTLDKAVSDLLDYKQKGILACGDSFLDER